MALTVLGVPGFLVYQKFIQSPEKQALKAAGGIENSADWVRHRS
jgi:hypothetical protein